MNVVVLTNPKHHWLLPGFAYLFNEFWPSQTVLVATYGRSIPALPDNFRFVYLDAENYPASRWSDGLIKLLDLVGERFILFLEDFYLNAPADAGRIAKLYDAMTRRPDVLRLDLWGDRKSNKLAKPYGIFGGSEVVITPNHAKYQASLQASIWNRELLRTFVERNWSPWDFEIAGSRKLATMAGITVLGAADPPLKYQPVYQKGSIDMARLRTIPEAQLKVVGKWLRA